MFWSNYLHLLQWVSGSKNPSSSNEPLADPHWIFPSGQRNRIYVSTNCVWLCILCGYLSDDQCEWSSCYGSKFMVINGWGGRLSIWWGLGLWGSGLKSVCKCVACLQKFSLCVIEQVCESHVHVCPVWGLKASSVYSVFRGKFSPRLYWMLQSHTTIPVKPFDHWQKHCTSLSLAGRSLVLQLHVMNWMKAGTWATVCSQ